MNRIDALRIIVRAGQREKGSLSMYRHLVRALIALGLEVPEIRFMLSYLDYFRPDGRPYDWLAAKLSKQDIRRVPWA